MGGVTLTYAINRIKRILLLMLIWNVPFVLLDIVKEKTFVNPIKHILLAGIQSGYLSHFWYLWALVFLYAISPILYKLFNDDKKSSIFTKAIILIWVI